MQDLRDALSEYVWAERKAMQWIPAQGPVRLQRFVMKRKDKRGALPCASSRA